MFLRELTQTIDTLKGAGPAVCARLSKAGINTIAELLRHYPRQDKYEDHITRRTLDSVIPVCNSGAFTQPPDAVSESREICTTARVSHISSIYIHKKQVPCITVFDGTAQASLLCFKNPELARALAREMTGAAPDISYLVWGNFTYSEKYHKIQSGDFEIEREDAPPAVLAKKHFGALLPVYRLSDGLRQWHFRTLIQNALAQFGGELENTLPPPLVEKYNLLSSANAIRAIHFPRGFDEQAGARRTLIYEELFYLELIIALRKKGQGGGRVKEKNDSTALQNRLLSRLPFPLTDGQKQVVAEINADILSIGQRPMARLLQGDVGSGKTLVSFLAALAVIEAGGQAVLMAPTELLAFQHAENAGRLLEPLGIHVAFLTGNVKSAGRKHLLSALASGDIDLAIGTHALFSADVVYRRLALVIIDEQHRFGVTQRQAILNKGIGDGEAAAENAQSPHLLMMSATPIPRTLAQTVFGDMDISVIHGMPPGRMPVLTRTFSQENEAKVYTLVRKELAAGHQAYFVYPLIGSEEAAEDFDSGKTGMPGGNDGLKDAQSMERRLRENVFPEYKTALLHSRLDDARKKSIMESFRNNEIQILAATSVVEVGVDVPNATCMVIEHADRFGLSALHQLRGRVGRGSAPSTCFLVWTPPESPLAREAEGERLALWQKRLKVMRETTDGFIIAEEDLKLRGPGHIAGTEQSGYFALGLANILRDAAVLEQARQDAFELVDADPRLEGHDGILLAAVLERARPFTDAGW
jgi:ATP-dependent DNA helicase RecG